MVYKSFLPFYSLSNHRKKHTKSLQVSTQRFFSWSASKKLYSFLKRSYQMQSFCVSLSPIFQNEKRQEMCRTWIFILCCSSLVVVLVTKMKLSYFSVWIFVVKIVFIRNFQSKSFMVDDKKNHQQSEKNFSLYQIRENWYSLNINFFVFFLP